MRDRGIIYTGLLLFLVFLTLPVWHNLFAGVTAKGPEPVLPKNEKQCVAPADYMKRSHMNLLLDWRETVVRTGAREYTAPDGRRFNMSLSNTCLHQCHTDKSEFCDRCHNYEAVALPCWDCHVDSKTAFGGGQ
jgi:hypothetical protein